MTAAAHDVEAFRARLGAKMGSDLRENLRAQGHGGKLRITPSQKSSALTLPWPGLGDLLPDGGLPRGVVELTAPHALGGSTSLALAAVRAGQARAGKAWCAWVDPEASLYAPGVVRAGVDVTRLLVVSTERVAVGRTAVKVVALGAFEVVVI